MTKGGRQLRNDLMTHQTYLANEGVCVDWNHLQLSIATGKVTLQHSWITRTHAQVDYWSLKLYASFTFIDCIIYPWLSPSFFIIISLALSLQGGVPVSLDFVILCLPTWLWLWTHTGESPSIFGVSRTGPRGKHFQGPWSWTLQEKVGKKEEKTLSLLIDRWCVRIAGKTRPREW